MNQITKLLLKSMKIHQINGKSEGNMSIFETSFDLQEVIVFVSKKCFPFISQLKLWKIFRMEFIP